MILVVFYCDYGEMDDAGLRYPFFGGAFLAYYASLGVYTIAITKYGSYGYWHIG